MHQCGASDALTVTLLVGMGCRLFAQDGEA